MHVYGQIESIAFNLADVPLLLVSIESHTIYARTSFRIDVWFMYTNIYM